jgi:hypothetical protein
MVRERLMPSFWTDPDHFSRTNQTPPVLTSFADEICATVARLFAYVGTLALIFILAFRGWDELQLTLADASHPRADWAMDSRSQPAFPFRQLDPLDKSETYLGGQPWGDGRNSLRRIGGDGLTAERVRIGCLLDRLTLMTSGNELKVSDLFAGAELKRGTCSGFSAASSDWMTGPEYPQLRGTL